MEITGENYHSRRRPRTWSRGSRQLAALLLAAAACGSGGERSRGAARGLPPLPDLSRPHDTAVIEVKDMGAIRVELFPELAPVTVARFEALARQGAYDGTTFHRVIPGFMIQGGDPNTKDMDPRNDGQGGNDAEMPREPSAWPHRRGTVSWAASGHSPHGSQFFIVQRDSLHLDGQHNVIGRVLEGMEVVDAITALKLDTYGRYGPLNRPYPVDARVTRVRIEPAGSAAAAAGAAAGAAVADSAATPASR